MQTTFGSYVHAEPQANFGRLPELGKSSRGVYPVPSTNPVRKKALNSAVHLNLDDAWPEGFLDVPTLDMREWGPRLRYVARGRDVEAFYREVEARLAVTNVVLYGSGDFHHLAGVMLRRVTEPVTLVSFDNHPDWDIRPPRWSCGGWINRALALPNVVRAAVWGCGNFELRFPARIFRNRWALADGQLSINGWTERQSESVADRFECMSRDEWRERFESFVNTMGGAAYVTVDLDCLREEEAVTNWENGLYTVADLQWAIGLLRDKGRIVGGDICGAYSEPVYVRRFQRFAGNWDHPKLSERDVTRARSINTNTVKQIWREMIGV